MTPPALWYRRPATGWTEALPIGNGRLGAMVFGGVEREELQLNEDTLWSGGPYAPTNPNAFPHLEAVRDHIFAGRYQDAQALAQETLLARPSSQMSYQPAGNLFLEFRHEAVPGSYRRTLDLEHGMITTGYALQGTGIQGPAPTITRTAFASAADGVIVVRVEASKPHSIDFEVWLDSPQPGNIEESDNAHLAFRGHNFGSHGITGKLAFGIDVKVRTQGGRIERRGRRIVVVGADSAEAIIDVATSFRRYDDISGDPDADLAARWTKIADFDFDTLLANHVVAYRERSGLFDIELGPERGDLATDERVVNFANGDDQGLAALYVHYARYLMISASRRGSQPANLQGIWNKDTVPPWGSKLTTNINLQMNYWLPDPANIPESVEPLIAMAEDLAQSGAEMARVHYNARGWVLHHNTDLWRATGPIDGALWGIWPTGGAWLMVQLWDHAKFEGRPIELVKRLFEPLMGATQFFLDVLVPMPGTPFLVTNPTMSPENPHHPGVTLCAGPTMDNQILRDLFTAFSDAAAQLDREQELAGQARAARERLPPHRIGRAGQLQEWMEDWDMDVPELHHRHVSHLYGLYPSTQISVAGTPELAAAARRSLEIRGDDATGWGIGWRINLWARLREGEHAHDVLGLLLSPARSYPNLFDAHPPFQIDGNFGGAAGIIEMLIQSDEESIRLLPALPKCWPRGRLVGVRARGGLVLDFGWEEGRLTSLTATARQPYAGTIFEVDTVLAAGLAQGKTVVI